MRDRHIHLGLHIRVESEVMHARNDPDNLHPDRVLGRIVKCDALADRIFTREKFTGETLVYNCHRWRLDIVACGKVPALQQRHS